MTLITDGEIKSNEIMATIVNLLFLSIFGENKHQRPMSPNTKNGKSMKIKDFKYKPGNSESCFSRQSIEEVDSETSAK